MLLTNLLLILVFIWVLIDDIRSRTIQAAAPMLILLLSIIRLVLQDMYLMEQLLFNALVMTGILVPVILYARIRVGKDFLHKGFGMGDIAMLLGIIPTFSISIMIYLIIAGAAVGVFGYFIIDSFKSRGIPLAGIYGALGAMFVIVEL